MVCSKSTGTVSSCILKKNYFRFRLKMIWIRITFVQVEGWEGLRNDVLYHPATTDQPAVEGAVIFFGGDVQDLEEEQAKHRDNR